MRRKTAYSDNTSFITALALPQRTTFPQHTVCAQPPYVKYRRGTRCQLSSEGNGAYRHNGTPNGQSVPRIQLMACDMDGTLLNSDVQVSATNIAAVKRLLDGTATIFIPATGKSRAGAVNAMGGLGEYLMRLFPGGCPGVFLQGLVVYGLNGELVYERCVERELARVVVGIQREIGLSLIAYCRDCILCEGRDEFVDLLPSYCEPEAEVIGKWERAIETYAVNKFIFMAEPQVIDEIRPLVERRVGELGHITQAQSNMLEVLPAGTSKGEGVKRLLDYLGVSVDNVLAVGDAENDLELLRMVRYSCAVANALPSVKKVAAFTDFPSNDEDAVAHVIQRFVLSGVDAVL